MTTFQLTERIKELIQKARIVSFDSWVDTHPAEAIALFQAADDDRRYLTDAELDQIQALAPAQGEMTAIAALLRDEVKAIVDDARAEVLDFFPDITQPGGGLYPPERAEACWRDFWHFFRCVTYGIAGGRTDYLSATGLDYMQQLYHEMAVPLEAMVKGLASLKTASFQRLTPAHADILSPYFDCLIKAVKQFT